MMEGSGGRWVVSSMVAVVMVAILVGLSMNTVGGESSSSSEKNCAAYLDPCNEETGTAAGCCNAVRRLVTDVRCFCTLLQGISKTNENVQSIQRACNVTLDTDICTKAETFELSTLPPTNSTPAPPSQAPSSSPTNSTRAPPSQAPPSSPTNSSQKNEASRLTWAMKPKWAAGLILLYIITSIIPTK